VTGWPGRRPASGVQCLTRLRAGDPGRVRRLAEIPRPGALPRRHEPVQLAGHPVIVVHGPNDSGVPPGWSPASPGVISVGSGASLHGRLLRLWSHGAFDPAGVKRATCRPCG
jgi:hypothetical protein